MIGTEVFGDPIALALLVVVVLLLPLRALSRRRRGAGPLPSWRYCFETIMLTITLVQLFRRHDLAVVIFAAPTPFRLTVHVALCFVAVTLADIVLILLTPRGVRRIGPSARQILAFIPVCIAGAIWEELCFRALPFALFGRGLVETTATVVASSAIFAAQHLRGSADAVRSSFIYGIVFCALYLLTDDLIAVMVAHAASNLATFVYFAPELHARAALSRLRSRTRPLPIG